MVREEIGFRQYSWHCAACGWQNKLKVIKTMKGIEHKDVLCPHCEQIQQITARDGNLLRVVQKLEITGADND